MKGYYEGMANFPSRVWSLKRLYVYVIVKRNANQTKESMAACTSCFGATELEIAFDPDRQHDRLGMKNQIRCHNGQYSLPACVQETLCEHQYTTDAYGRQPAETLVGLVATFFW